MQNIFNPFFTTPEIPDEYFCDRVEETEELKRLILSRNNVLLTSPRRMGKTGLIYHLFNQASIKETYNCFFIDIYETSSFEELIVKLGKEVSAKLAKSNKSHLQHFLQALQSLRGEFSFDPGTGMPVFSIGIGDIRKPEITLDEIFSYLEQADRPCVVAIDEFQKIADYQQKNIEALLRTKIQRLHNCQFIFSGSERSILSQMFFSKDRPFYQSISSLNLERITEEKYLPFVKNLFEQNGKQIEEKCIREVFTLLEGYTYYMQRTFNDIFSTLPANTVCNTEFALGRIEHIVASNHYLYQEILASLTPNQRALICAVARDKTSCNITSRDYVEKHSLGSSSSVQSAARSLLKRQLLSRYGDTYRLDDKFMERYLSNL